MGENSKTTSQDLLACGTSGVLDRLQSFLPQIAKANEKLKQQMEETPEGHFDIENIESAKKVIEMDIALVELSGVSDDESQEEDEDTSDSDVEESEIVFTEKSLKLAGHKGKKENINIQVIEQSGK
ncbi:NOP protein chaperone 1 isoform X2 [Stigmatopora argus]